MINTTISCPTNSGSVIENTVLIYDAPSIDAASYTDFCHIFQSRAENDDIRTHRPPYGDEQ